MPKASRRTAHVSPAFCLAQLARKAGQSLGLIAALGLAPLPVLAADADTFRTDEYHALSTSRKGSLSALDVINAAGAYAAGYTGAGQTVGVLDQPVDTGHPELAGKAGSVPVTVAGEPFAGFDWAGNTHGSHVAGILAARRDGTGMHGLAYDASLWSAPLLLIGAEADEPDLAAWFAAKPEMRIINCSWSDSAWMEGGDQVPLEEIHEMRDELTSWQVVETTLDHPKRVFVFAAGNDGQLSPSIGNTLPYLFGQHLAYVSVGNLNSGGITRNGQGDLVLSPVSVAYTSNLSTSAELYTVMAPGTGILSLDSGTSGYREAGGTSMAAPLVSGAMALVAQAHPWMTGRQLADTILSTASKTYVAPDYVILADRKTFRFVILADSQDAARAKEQELVQEYGNGSEEDAMRAMLIHSWELDDTPWGVSLERLLGAFENRDKAFVWKTREQVFGQGILDAEKAVRGPAELNANRMRADNVQEVAELGRQDALVTLNTQGYTSEFSNDISQVSWEDAYHHPQRRSNSNSPYSADARALAGKDVGILKAGAGTLILSGTNTYQGATVIEGGTLAVAKRSDGTGGELTQSNVVVRSQGTLTGDGTIRQGVVNNGTVMPGLAGNTLTVGDYVQSETGTLRIPFDAGANHPALATTNADLDGTLALQPVADFYGNGQSMQLGNLLTGAVTGSFASTVLASSSPTLTFSLLGASATSATVGSSRASSAYSRYADNDGAATLGRALVRVADTAQGDMRTLLTALDWSARDGSTVRAGLDALGAEAYDASARASLQQQSEFSLVLLHRMLGNMAASRMRQTQGSPAVTGIASPLEESPDAATWQAWASPYGSGAWQQSSNGLSSWNSQGLGLVAGMDRFFDSGLTLGFHLAVAARRTSVDEPHDARADTLSAFAGVQALYAPGEWNGFYVMGQGRLGLEDGEMDRTIHFNGYTRHNESHWTGLAGSALLGFGKDWTLQAWDGQVNLGPLAFAEYLFVHRPSITEDGGQASRLELDETLYDSLPISLGAHAGLQLPLDKGSALGLDVLAAWRHELLEGTFETGASFRGYGAHGFSTSSEIAARDSVLVQGSVRLTHASGFFAQVEGGGQFGSHATSANVAFQLGWNF